MPGVMVRGGRVSYACGTMLATTSLVLWPGKCQNILRNDKWKISPFHDEWKGKKPRKINNSPSFLKVSKSGRNDASVDGRRWNLPLSHKGDVTLCITTTYYRLLPLLCSVQLCTPIPMCMKKKSHCSWWWKKPKLEGPTFGTKTTGTGTGTAASTRTWPQSSFRSTSAPKLTGVYRYGLSRLKIVSFLWLFS